MSLDFSIVNRMVAELTALDFYPVDVAARAAIVRMVGNMANSEEEVRWLVDQATSGIYKKWPGLYEIRCLYCSRFNPRDGIVQYSEIYPDGYPYQLNRARQIEAPPLPKLSPEEKKENEEFMREFSETLATKIKEMPKARRPAPRELTAEEKQFLEAERERLNREREERKKA